jgi:hypothetical protein
MGGYSLFFMDPPASRGGSAVLVIAHPGHELRVHGWLERTRPRVLVLTDGSGHTGSSRLDSTARILAGAKATPGPVFGALTDRQAYDALLSGDIGLFAGLARRVSEELVDPEVETVLGDAEEGYNPMHDICRYVVDAAAALAGRKRPAPPGVYDFPLAGPPTPEGFDPVRDGLSVHLSDDEFARKVAATKSYARLDADVAAALKKYGEDAFRIESLRRIRATLRPTKAAPPFYETYGEGRVAAGSYAVALRYREHVQPVEEALWKQFHGRD